MEQVYGLIEAKVKAEAGAGISAKPARVERGPQTGTRRVNIQLKFLLEVQIMEQMTQPKGRAMKYILPIAGAAIPAFFLIKRRRMSDGQMMVCRDQELLEESCLDVKGAMNIARKHIRGTPVEVELKEEHGIPAWEVEILPRNGGPVRELLIDARTGDLLEMKSDYSTDVEPSD